MNQVCIIRHGSYGFVATGAVLTSLWRYVAPISPESSMSLHPGPKVPGIPIKLLN